MKKVFFSLAVVFSLAASAQDAPIAPATAGTVYGTALTADAKPVSVNDLQKAMVNNVFEGQVTGKVVEVCKAMGCWIKIEKADGTTVMVKSKDHGFMVGQDLIGKTVTLEGTAAIKKTTEAKRRHYAEDAGKSKKEIKKIKGDTEELQFVASGIRVEG